MLLLITIAIHILHITEEVHGIDLNANGFINVEPNWLFDAAKQIARNGNHTDEYGSDSNEQTVAYSEEETVQDTTLSDIQHKKRHKHKREGIEKNIADVVTNTGTKSLNDDTKNKSKKQKFHVEIVLPGIYTNNDSGKDSININAKLKNKEASKTKLRYRHHKNKRSKTTTTAATATTTSISTRTIEKIHNMDEYFNKVARNGEESVKITHAYELLRDGKGLYDTPHDVKEEKSIKNFTAHIYKESLKVLKDIKHMVNATKIKKRLDEMTNSYKDKFADFVNETLQQRIKTRIGTQKVILNTIEVSNRMLRTIVNNLKSEIDNHRGKGHLREYVSVSNTKLDEKVDNQSDLEYLHACQSLGICRSNYGYSQFLATIVTEALKNDDRKLRQANDALIEALKYADFSEIVDHKHRKQFKDKIKYLEKLDSVEMRSTYQAFRNMLVSSNRPITVFVNDKDMVTRSLALRDLIDVLDQKIPPTSENKAEWDNMRMMMKEWTLGRTKNVQEVARKVVKQLVWEGIARIGTDHLQSVQDKMAIILKEYQ